MICPIEHKSGSRHGQTADIQLCAQALCLEWMTGQSVHEGFIWYSTSRRRHAVEFDEALRQLTLDRIESIRHMIESGEVPAAPADARCEHCQLRPRCLPNVISAPAHARSLADSLLRYEAALP